MAKEIKFSTGLEFNIDNNAGVSTPIVDVLDDSDISLNTKMLALCYYKFGLGTNVPIVTMDNGRKYMTSAVGQAIMAFMEQ